MKIAILSDIHGNRQALETVIAHIDNWQPDHVVVNGDTVNRGPCSLPCYEMISARMATGWQHTLGNHEGYHLNILGKEPSSDLERKVFLPLYKVHAALNGQVEAFQTLPMSVSLYAPDNSEVRVTHASMVGNRDGIFADNAVAQVKKQIAPSPTVFVTSHTHMPFQRQVEDTLVVNTGSVGTSADQDVRASYAQIMWENGRWSAQIIRLDYDRDATVRDFHDSGFLSDDDFFAQLLFQEWLNADYYAGPWMNLYHGDVKAGKIEFETAVIQYLAQREAERNAERTGEHK